MIRKLWPGLALLALATAFGVAMLHHLPPRVASHWGLDGQPNGWTSRTALVLLTPIGGVVLAVILVIAPKLDPKRRNFPLHADAYWVVANAVLAFIAGLHVAILGYNLGWPINLGLLIGVGAGLLFMVLGNLLTRVRPNWIFGIRTPWTLSSDRSWRESHRVGGYAFVLVGLAVVITALVAPHAVYLVLGGGVLVAAVVSVVWSYVVWTRDPDAQGHDA